MQLSSALFKHENNNKKKPSAKEFLIFQEMELSGSNIKTNLIFRELKTLKRFFLFKERKRSWSNIRNF